MKIVTVEKSVSTRGYCSIVDITPLVDRELNKTGLKEGQVLIFTVGSTAAVSTIEYEPNLVKDVEETLEMIAPSSKRYHHALTWNDDNGFSHVRSTLMKSDLVVPFKGAKLILGTWQQIVILDFDNSPRERKFVLQFTGE